MEWLASAVSKIQSTIQESREEFLAEQARCCGDEQAMRRSQPAMVPQPAGAPASEHDGRAAVLQPGGIEHGLEQAEAVLERLKSVGLVMLNPLGDDEETRSAANRREQEEPLPWERPGLSAERCAQMQALSKDHMAFLTLPPEDTPFSFDLTATMPTIMRLLQSDPQIERWRFLLVPKRCAPVPGKRLGCVGRWDRLT